MGDHIVKRALAAAQQRRMEQERSDARVRAARVKKLGSTLGLIVTEADIVPLSNTEYKIDNVIVTWSSREYDDAWECEGLNITCLADLGEAIEKHMEENKDVD